jgi:hypothetical protein
MRNWPAVAVLELRVTAFPAFTTPFQIVPATLPPE